MKKLIGVIMLIGLFGAMPAYAYAKHNNGSYNKRYVSNNYYDVYNCRSSCGGSAYYSAHSYYPSYDYVGSNYAYSNYSSGCGYGCNSSYYPAYSSSTPSYYYDQNSYYGYSGYSAYDSYYSGYNYGSYDNYSDPSYSYSYYSY